MSLFAGRVRELLILVGLFAAVCWPLISSVKTSDYGFDELNYHLPAVTRIADHWPVLDLVNDSLSATAPGYHYLLATVAQITGDDVHRIRLINWAVSVAILVLIYIHVRRRLCGLDASLLILPLAASNFFIKSASWVVTDNAALLCVAIALLAALEPFAKTATRLQLTLAPAIAVFVRQLTIWTAVLPFARYSDNYVTAWNQQRREMLLSLLMGLPPFLVLALLYRAWGGLVPPVWSDASLRFSTAGPVYLFSVFALFGVFFLPSDSVRSAFAAPARRATLTAFLGGVLFSFTTETTQDHAVGRWGGYLWTLGMKLPFLGNHSLFFALLCGVGVSVIFIFWRSLRAQKENQSAPVFLLGLAAFAATFLVNRQVFHRYFEPTTLLFLIAIGPFLLTQSTGMANWRLRMTACGVIQIIATVSIVHVPILFSN